VTLCLARTASKSWAADEIELGVGGVVGGVDLAEDTGLLDSASICWDAMLVDSMRLLKERLERFVDCGSKWSLV
jgi:hypothetical protein